MASTTDKQEITLTSRTEQSGQGVKYPISQQRSLYPSSTQVDYNQPSRSSLSRTGERTSSRAQRTHRSHTPSVSLRENYQKQMHYELLGVGSQFADFGSARVYQTPISARAPPDNRPIHEDHLNIARSSIYIHELAVLDFALDIGPVDEHKSQQELEQREDEV